MGTEIPRTVPTIEHGKNEEDRNSEISEIRTETASSESNYASKKTTSNSDSGGENPPKVETLTYTPAQPSLYGEIGLDGENVPNNESDSESS